MNELDFRLIKDRESGKEVAISGNAAIARALLEGSVKVITSYPGAPCAEIVEELSLLSNDFNFHIEWSVNEKVALEVAMAAAMSGVRAAFITKHVGMNVASDPLVHICYSGVNAGMVIISADDPGAFNSNVEEDSRIFARLAEIPGIEPSDQQEAKDIVLYALTTSEKIELPVFIRVTNRLLYGRGKIITGEIQNIERNAQFRRNSLRWFIAGSNAVRQHKWLHKQQKELKNIVESAPFNSIEWAAQKKYGIITSGISYYYAKEAIRELSAEENISILKIAYFNPLPEDYIKQFLNKVEEVLVVEELEPFLEERIKGIASEVDKKVKIYGKLTQHFPETDSLYPEDVKDVILNLWLKDDRIVSIGDSKKEDIKQEFDKLLSSLPNDSIAFCPGCPHRASLYILKRTLKELNEEFVITSDVGCYQMGVIKPLRLADSVFCMGASIGVANGFYQANLKKRIIASIGDSTFLHAGIPALINCCYTNVDILVYILDNRSISMTGLQPYAGIGLNMKGEKTKSIQLEGIIKACKVDYLKIIDPFRLKAAEKTLLEALRMKGQRVVIARSECAQLAGKNIKQRAKLKKCKIDYKKCKQCRICFLALGCPAILIKNSAVYINEFLCSGCGLCNQICPHKAINY